MVNFGTNAMQEMSPNDTKAFFQSCEASDFRRFLWTDFLHDLRMRLTDISVTRVSMAGG